MTNRNKEQSVSNAAADAASEYIANANNSLNPKKRFRRSIHSMQFCAFILDETCTVVDANIHAISVLDLKTGSTLFKNAYEISRGFDLNSQVRTFLSSKENKKEFQLVSAFIQDQSKLQRLALCQVCDSEGVKSEVLVVLISSSDQSNAIQLISKKFNLTDTETEIGGLMASGISLREIADQRERSYKTVRNQFQQVLEKVECNSQTQFMRLANDLSAILTSRDHAHQNENAPEFRKLMIPRPRGRSVEIVIAGDEDGMPLISIAGIFGHEITPNNVRILKERGCFIISMLRPGHGTTDKPLEGQSFYECIAADMCAVMDSMEIDKCNIITHGTATVAAYNLASLIPERITRIICLQTMVPKKFYRNTPIGGKWVDAIVADRNSDKAILNVVATVHRKLTGDNPSTFIEGSKIESESDLAYFKTPGSFDALKDSYISTTVRGLGGSIRDLTESYQDWSLGISGFSTLITIVHGSQDTSTPIEIVRNFVQQLSSDIDVIELQGAGHRVLHTHFKEICDIVLMPERS